MKKVLTFDCYGTLLDTSSLDDYVKRVALKNGLDGDQAVATFTDLQDRFMYGNDFMPFDQLIRRVLRYCDFELNTNVFSDKGDQALAVIQNYRPFKDVLPALQELKASGYELIIMSDTTQELAKFHQKKLGNLIDQFVTSDETHCYKPNLNFFNYAARKYNLVETDHVHVATGYWWDIVPCTTLGWHKIWVNRYNFNGFKEQQPYATIKDLSSLLAVLQAKY